MSKEKKNQITVDQKTCLVEFMKTNSDLQSGKFSNNFTYRDAQRKWNEIGTILNSMPGATRDWKSWRKTWQDLKSRTKNKIGSKLSHARGTGGGPPMVGDLSKTEEDIMDIVKPVSIGGHKEVRESRVDFDLPDNEIIVVEVDPPPASPASVAELEIISHPIEQPVPKKKRTSSALKNTVDAVNHYKLGMDNKMTIKQRYYEEKLKLLTKIANSKEKKANALERIANALEMIAQNMK